jgi:hypothetical protein
VLCCRLGGGVLLVGYDLLRSQGAKRRDAAVATAAAAAGVPDTAVSSAVTAGEPAALAVADVAAAEAADEG